MTNIFDAQNLADLTRKSFKSERDILLRSAQNLVSRLKADSEKGLVNTSHSYVLSKENKGVAALAINAVSAARVHQTLCEYLPVEHLSMKPYKSQGFFYFSLSLKKTFHIDPVPQPDTLLITSEDLMSLANTTDINTPSMRDIANSVYFRLSDIIESKAVDGTLTMSANPYVVQEFNYEVSKTTIWLVRQALEPIVPSGFVSIYIIDVNKLKFEFKANRVIRV